MIRGIQKLSDLSADADISLIPVPWHDAIINVGAYFGFQGLDDTRASQELEIGEIRIADMARNYGHDIGRHRVMQPVEDGNINGIQYVLPSNYGPFVS
jgi:hypothetical protein